MEMACRGVYFALTDEQTKRLLAAPSDEGRLEIIEEIEEDGWEEAYGQETDKAWDAIHRCLSEGSLAVTAGSYPLNRCVLGGRHLYEGENYIIALVQPHEVKDVASALAAIDQDWMRARYSALASTDYAMFVSEDDFDYTWGWFQELRAFYQKAANAGRTVIFTVDQ
jgi:uncharacterized protein DUF1877